MNSFFLYNIDQMSSGMEIDTFSLEEIERALSYGIDNSAIMIYFHHGTQSFMFFIESDRAQFQEEMGNLERAVRGRSISAITAGEPINIGGTDIFPMDVRVDDVPCYPYMLLRRRGSFDDADCTPYFFQSQQRRDETVAYLSQILDAVSG